LWTPQEALIFTQAFPRSLMLIDNDGDSLFSEGDALEIYEPVLGNLFDSEHRGSKYKVMLQHSIEPLEPVETLAKLTWVVPAQ